MLTYFAPSSQNCRDDDLKLSPAPQTARLSTCSVIRFASLLNWFFSRCVFPGRPIFAVHQPVCSPPPALPHPPFEQASTCGPRLRRRLNLHLSRFCHCEFCPSSITLLLLSPRPPPYFLLTVGVRVCVCVSKHACAYVCECVCVSACVCMGRQCIQPFSHSEANQWQLIRMCGALRLSAAESGGR